ncbi:hypothetical protein FB451DRAFT_1275035 [Mycena latifolia]|nr:hypothetical protein FB451DRAFT_1275035 [Mycena latifolia]
MDGLTMADIPPEIISEILAFLDAKTLLLCSSVSRLWHATVSSSPELQYMIELWAEGMLPGNPGTLTPAETLGALQVRRRAWQNMEWTSQNVVQIESLLTCRAFELVAGFFSQQTVGPNFCTIALPLLPSVQVAGGAWTTSTFGIDPVDFQDFAIDPTQDLVAILHTPGEVAHLECRTISALVPHPLAALPVVTFPLPHDPLMALSIQIADDVIALFFPEVFRLFIFNWRMGVIITDDSSLSPTVFDFDLLSSRSYVLTDLHTDYITIHSFTKDARIQPVHVATLQLPDLVPGGFIDSITIHTGPLCARAISGTPFSASNEARICMLLIGVNEGAWARLFVHYRVLQQYAEEHERAPTSAPRVVNWHEWGPQSTRILPGEDHRWLRHVHGERVALPCADRHFVEILDFGIGSLRDRRDSHTAAAHVTSEVHLDSAVFEAPDVFADDVTTSLPYRRTVCRLGTEYDLFLIDQDHLIGINNSNAEAANRMTVYTF